MRVLFTNNYDMARARAGWRAGVYPGHHLYGTAELGPEFEVVDVQLRPAGLVGILTEWAGDRIGNLGLQVNVVLRLRRNTVVYGAQARDLAALALLRRAGILRVPLVAIYYGKSAPGRLGRMALRGFDHLVAMSTDTRDSLVDMGVPAERVDVLGWGPDLDFPGFSAAPRAANDAPVVATGKTGRDMGLLVEALRRVGAPARVYGKAEEFASETLPENVTIVPSMPPSSTQYGQYSYEYTLSDLHQASVVAIPLRERHPLHGLTEIADALACAKPVIVTRASYFDVDVEAIGCGWWVEPGDVDGWTRALREALSDRERLARMGEAGREWARARWNARKFADDLRLTLSRAGRAP